MSEPLEALRSSVQRLQALSGLLTVDDLRSPAYPAEWSIADTFSHIGSGAVILRNWLHTVTSGIEADADFAPKVWDAWNAKSPEAKVTDALVADQLMLEALDEVGPQDRARFAFALGPMKVDFDGFAWLRLNEHVVHTWDIEVAIDPEAELNAVAVPMVLENLALVIRFGGRTGNIDGVVRVHTTAPERDMALVFESDAITLDPHTPGASDLTMPAETFIRLVYGRAGADRPGSAGSGELIDLLRASFPGV
jgi:uncharacterized protein (TIGR03083 family)